MNLLTEGIEKKFVLPTDQKVKLNIDGQTSTYNVYRVQLDYLYFNDQNDRIATWISQYKAEKGIDILDRTNQSAYNDIIQDFITKSNPDKMKSTQTNIEYIGQQKYGVVLFDGRIIDGNRRFCCLRNLAKQDSKFNYFETVILDKSIENNAKQIKMLELQIQIGEESRVDYNPIDRLVGVYRDIVEEKLLTEREYAQSTNLKETEVKKLVERSKLLVEFLEAINSPKQFYRARELDVDGPLVELQNILSSVKEEEIAASVKYIVFTNLLVKPDGDMTRFIRKVKGIVKSEEDKYLADFIDKEIEIADEVLNNLPAPGKVTEETISELRADEDLKEKLVNTMDIADNKVKATAVRNAAAQNLKKACGIIEGIDTNIFVKLNDEQLSEIKTQIVELEKQLDRIKGELDA